MPYPFDNGVVPILDGINQGIQDLIVIGNSTNTKLDNLQSSIASVAIDLAVAVTAVQVLETVYDEGNTSLKVTQTP